MDSAKRRVKIGILNVMSNSEITYSPIIMPNTPEIGRTITKTITSSIRASLIGIKRVKAMGEPSGKNKILKIAINTTQNTM